MHRFAGPYRFVLQVLQNDAAEGKEKTGVNRVSLEATAAEISGIHKDDIRAVVSAIEKILTDQLARGGTVSITGFGTFTTQPSPARTYKNPRTGEPVEVDERRRVVFRPSRELKKRLNARSGKPRSGKPRPSPSSEVAIQGL